MGPLIDRFAVNVTPICIPERHSDDFNNYDVWSALIRYDVHKTETYSLNVDGILISHYYVIM